MPVAPPAQSVQVSVDGSNSLMFQLGYVLKPAPCFPVMALCILNRKHVPRRFSSQSFQIG